MKLWIVMFVLLTSILVGGLVLERSILKATDRLSHSLDLVKDAIRDNQWQEALKLWEQLSNMWDLQQASWSPVIHNHELDALTVHLARLKSFLETEEKALALAEIAEVEHKLVQLHKEEVLTLENIF